MSIYAKDTSVSVERSRAEIEKILSRYGASAFAYATNGGKTMIQFEAHNRRIRFYLRFPLADSDEFKYHTHNGQPQKWRERGKEAARSMWEQSCRQRWRALALSIKARLEAASSEIDTFEDAFMSHIVLPDGKTVGEHMAPQIKSAYESGKMPDLLPYFGNCVAK